MELALYHPEAGYYSRHPAAPEAPGFRAVGREGDFFTSVSVGETFGFLIAEAILREWEQRFGRPSSFVIVEQGAHDGRLARDILTALAGYPDVACEYRIIEPRARLRTILSERLEDLPVRVVATAEEARAEKGIFLCNELLDAFPVDLFVFSEGTWHEEWIGCEDSGFKRVRSPIRPSYVDLVGSFGTAFPEGYRTEVCPGLEVWMRKTSGLFESGLWWIFDYGHEAADHRDPERNEGTLRAFRNQQRCEDLLADPGEQDLTADVDFSRLGDLAKAWGLELIRFTDQHHFLVEAARPWLQSIDGTPPDSITRKRLRQFQTLTHPAMMGRQFKVMELGRS